MCAASVVVFKVCRQHTAQVALIDDDDVIEAFAADRADDASDIGVLPRRSWRGNDLLDGHRLDTVAEGRPYEASRSRSRKRGAVSQGKASVIWRASRLTSGLE